MSMGRESGGILQCNSSSSTARQPPLFLSMLAIVQRQWRQMEESCKAWSMARFLRLFRLPLYDCESGKGGWGGGILQWRKGWSITRSPTPKSKPVCHHWAVFLQSLGDGTVKSMPTSRNGLMLIKLCHLWVAPRQSLPAEGWPSNGRLWQAVSQYVPKVSV